MIQTSERTPTGQAKPARPRKIKRVVIMVMPILVLGTAFFGLKVMGRYKPVPETKTEAPRATPVVTSKAEARSTRLSVTSQGEVRARTETDLSSLVGGQIIWASSDFLEGGHIRKGQVLIKLDPVDYDLRVTQAEANVAQARTVLTREISESEIAKKDWADLGEGEATPLTLRKPQMAEAKARIASARAALAEAKLQQQRTRIRAPFNGRIIEKSVSLGDTIGQGQKIARLFAVDTVEIKLPLTNSDLAKLGLGVGFLHTPKTPGPKVDLSAEVSGQMHHWTGRLTRTASSFDPKTRLLFAYVTIHDPYGQSADKGVPLAPGLFVQALIKGRKIERNIVLPRAALRGKDKVYIARQDDTLTIRNVNVTATSRDEVVISSGLDGGEYVITSPIRGVAEGMKIERVEAAARSQPATRTEAGQ